MTTEEIYEAAGLTAEDIRMMPAYIQGRVEFYDTPAFTALYEYFAFETGAMPYGTAKARDGMPDEWILEQLAT
jgi:hypothetical protein